MSSRGDNRFYRETQPPADQEIRYDEDGLHIYWADPVEGCWVAFRRVDCVGEEELPERRLPRTVFGQAFTPTDDVMSEAQKEAERRWPTPDPHTGADLQPVDAARRQGFVAGAEWQASRAPQPTEDERRIPGFAERERRAQAAWEFYARNDRDMSHDFRAGYHQGTIDEARRRAPAEPAVTEEESR